MATTKTATLTIRVEPSLKEALKVAAQAEHRSIANMIEVMIRQHCKENCIEIKKLKN
ncbi:MAG: ribbon-helix-helix protein, CopG family [Alteromonadaceae bacterium TMED7]|nr:MAG: ribbon-helix-helix protein, CopG family [Alteromonadaceae bacterium TMED7]HCV05994.1 ribbon-helix-helix protein, CopG family [Pseudoalteromonas sp.]|tara:strand:+ start:377 stop:547 length:171 start_codon:yes stop_codon:yes gene_type:complete